MPTYYAKPYRHRSEFATATAWVVGIAIFVLFLTDCHGGHVEYVSGQIRLHEFVPAHWQGKSYQSDCYLLLVALPDGTFEKVQTTPQHFFTTHDMETTTYHRTRTLWTNYTFNPSL